MPFGRKWLTEEKLYMAGNILADIILGKDTP
jgi:hypothetical protein